MRKRFISLLLALSILLCAVPVVTAAETAPKFTKYSLTLNKSIAINFKVPHAAVEGIFEKVVFTKGDETSEISKLPAADKDGMAVFTFKDLSPSELATSVTATLITSAGETSVTRSVKDYCMSALAKETTAGKLKTLIVDLLNYGSAFQTYKGETELANADLTDAQKAWATKESPVLDTDVVDNTEGAITHAGLVLADSVQLFFDADKDMDVSTLKVNGTTVYPSGENGRFYFDKLNPDQMRDVVTVQAYNSAGNAVGGTLEYSIVSYAYYQCTNDETSEELKALLEAMMKYGDAAESYVVDTEEKPTTESVDAIYISADAEAGMGDGSIENPYATIHEAQATIRSIKENGKYPETGITVYFREGQYSISETVLFEASDSGEMGAPVVYKAYGDETVTFVGGIDVPLTEFTDVTDPDILSRLAEGMADKVKQINLASLGFTDYGQMNVYGHSLIVLNNWAKLDYPDDQPPELLFDGETMSLARWPNDSTVTIASVVDKGDVVIDWFENRADHTSLIDSKWKADPEGATFTVSAEVAARMAKWSKADDIWAHGYWLETWSDQSLPIESIDADTGTVKAGIPSAYGTAAGRTFHFYNLLEEIDSAGEYYIDRSTGTLYFYPPKTSGTASLSLLPDAMLLFNEGTHDVCFEGITLKAGRSHGISLDGAERISITNCEISRFADKGVEMEDSRDVVINGCHLYDLGTGGIHITTSEEFFRPLMGTLESTGIVVENCEIHNFSRITKTYSPAVYTGGIGTVVRNCKIYDADCNAITLKGNDTLIENNEIFNVLQTDGDKGVFYGGTAKDTMGIMIRNNYIHDISTTSSSKIYVVYADDTKDGITAESNLIVNFGGTAFFVNGGWDNVFRHNVLINCDATGTITAAGISANRDVATDGYYENFRYAYQNHFDVYSEKYPHWEGKLEDLIQRNTCKYNVIADNVVINVDAGIYTASWEQHMVEEIYANNTLEDGDSYALADVGFANIDNGEYTVNENGSVSATNSNFAIKEDSIIYDAIEGFVAYDLSKIGLPGSTLGTPGPLGDLQQEENDGGSEEVAPTDALLYDNFSNVNNWSVVKGSAGSWSYNSNEGQLQISVDPGTGNIAKIYSNAYGWEWIQKKISIEFDIVNVSKDTNSDFVAGFALMQWNTNAFTVNIHKGILRTNWSGTGIDVSDGNHRVKIISDPTVNTFSVYLDGELIKEGVGYLSGSSWNRFGFFADTNNSQNTMSACFDNLTVTEVKDTPEEEVPQDALMFENFSNVNSWSSVTGSAGSWSYTSSEDQLQISVDPGTQNIAKIYSNDYGWEWIQKKISIEFDIVNVSKDTNSNFVAGFALMQWNTNAFTVNIHKGILRTNWSGTGIDVSDGTHRVKIISDPSVNTFSVYLDGELIKEGVGYLNGSSWNRFGFFADTNDSQNTMSAWFDNLTVTEVLPTYEVVFETVEADPLTAETDKWSSSTGITAEMNQGTVAVEGSNVDAAVSYTGSKYQNTVFNFTYKQDHNGSTDNPWGGFGLQTSAGVMPWTTNSVLICMKPDKVELQYWGTEYSGIIEKTGSYLKVGQEQEITFGMYDLNPATNEVKIVLNIDGVDVFNETVTDDILCGFEGYFTLIGSNGGVKATLGEAVEPTQTVVLTEDFSTVSKWEIPTNITADGWSFTSNTDGQLQINLNPGRETDGRILWNTNNSDWQNQKTILEFDIANVDTDVSSKFHAGFNLTSWNTSVFSVNVFRGYLRVNSTSVVALEEGTHRVKIVNNPNENTISVFLDGNLVHSGTCITGWNRIAFYAAGNNTQNTMSACFDNLKFAVEE